MRVRVYVRGRGMCAFFLFVSSLGNFGICRQNENTLTGYKAQDFISALSSGVFFALSGEQNEHTHELNHGSSTRI